VRFFEPACDCIGGEADSTREPNNNILFGRAISQLKGWTRGPHAPKPLRNRSASMCDGLWSLPLAFLVSLRSLWGPIWDPNRRFPAGILFVLFRAILAQRSRQLSLFSAAALLAKRTRPRAKQREDRLSGSGGRAGGRRAAGRVGRGGRSAVLLLVEAWLYFGRFFVFVFLRIGYRPFSGSPPKEPISDHSRV
jgi:hypothetical protein